MACRIIAAFVSALVIAVFSCSSGPDLKPIDTGRAQQFTGKTKFDKTPGRFQLEKGKRDHLKGDYTDAVKAFTEGLGRIDFAAGKAGRPPREFKYFASLLLYRGWSYYELKEYGKAEADFRRVAAQYPGNMAGYYNLALMFSKLEQYDKVYEPLDKAVKINPNDPDLRQLLKRLRAVMKKKGNTRGNNNR